MRVPTTGGSATAARLVLAFVVLLATAAALSAVPDRVGVYSTDAEVLFLAPETPASPNSIQTGDEGLIATAGLMQHAVMLDPPRPFATGSDVPLSGLGVRDGISISQPSSGGQWARNFDRPVLRVQVVGGSAQEVRARLDGVVQNLRIALIEYQSRLRVPRDSRISAQLAPGRAMRHASGDSTRAAGGILLLGVLVFYFGAARIGRPHHQLRGDPLSSHTLPVNELRPPL